MCTALSRTNWITENCTHAVYERTWLVTKLVIWDSIAFDTFCTARRAVTALQSYRERNASIM